MAISYAWDVNTVDTRPSLGGKSDVVYNVHWRIQATDDDNTFTDSEDNEVNYTSGSYGSIGISTEDTESNEDFIEFEDLTTSDVQSWVEDAIGSDEVDGIKEGLDNQILEQITPTSETKNIG